MLKFLQNLFTVKVSDDEFDRELKEGNAIQCPNCGVYIEYDMWEDMKHKCPSCKKIFDCHKLDN